jgi:hypothetical protein
MLGWWTIGRATGIGVTSALFAIIVWPFQAAYHDLLLWPFFSFLVVAGLCGASILLITIVDLLFHRPRGGRLRPVRAFDLAVAVALLGLSLIQLGDLAGQLPAWTLR